MQDGEMLAHREVFVQSRPNHSLFNSLYQNSTTVSESKAMYNHQIQARIIIKLIWLLLEKRCAKWQ